MALSTIGTDGPWTAPVQYRYRQEAGPVLPVHARHQTRPAYLERPPRLCCHLQPPRAARRESRLADKRHSRASDRRVLRQRMAELEVENHRKSDASTLASSAENGDRWTYRICASYCQLPRGRLSAHAVNAGDTETTSYWQNQKGLSAQPRNTVEICSEASLRLLTDTLVIPSFFLFRCGTTAGSASNRPVGSSALSRFRW